MEHVPDTVVLMEIMTLLDPVSLQRMTSCNRRLRELGRKGAFFCGSEGCAQPARIGAWDVVLTEACAGGHMFWFRNALNMGAKSSKIPLQMAVRNSDRTMIEILLELGADPIDGMREAVVTGSVPLASLFCGMLPDASRGLNGQSFMRDAARNSDSKMVEFLAMRGVTEWDDGFEEACSVGDLWLMEYFLDRGAKVFSGELFENFGGDTLLGLVRRVVENGSTDLNRPMWFSGLYGRSECVAYLSELGAPRMNYLNASLIRASEEGDVEEVERLLVTGVTELEGAIEAAAASGRTSVVRLLMRIPGIDASSAMYWSVRNGHADTVHALIAAGARDDMLIITGALRNGDATFFEHLLDTGVIGHPYLAYVMTTCEDGKDGAIIECLRRRGIQPFIPGGKDSQK